MLELMTILHQLYEDSRKIEDVDFRMMKDLFKKCFGDEYVYIMTAMCRLLEVHFRGLNCFKIGKVLSMISTESFKLAAKSDLFVKYINLAKHYLKFNRDDIILAEETVQAKQNLDLLKSLLQASIENTCDEEEAAKLAEFDEKNAEILMGVFKDFILEIDEDFAKIPSRIKNVNEAENVGKQILGFSNKIVQLSKKNATSKLPQKSKLQILKLLVQKNA
jgi:hypothetical protein